MTESDIFEAHQLLVIAEAIEQAKKRAREKGIAEGRNQIELEMLDKELSNQSDDLWGLLPKVKNKGIEQDWNAAKASKPDRKPKPQKCRVCGCTEDNACDFGLGPCHWVEKDLCDQCELDDFMARKTLDSSKRSVAAKKAARTRKLNKRKIASGEFARLKGGKLVPTRVFSQNHSASTEDSVAGKVLNKPEPPIKKARR